MTGLTEVARRVTDLRSRPAPDRLAEAAALVPLLDELLDDRVDPDSAINLWTMLAREVTGRAVPRRDVAIARATVLDALAGRDPLAAVHQARQRADAADTDAVHARAALRATAVAAADRRAPIVHVARAAGVTRQMVYEWMADQRNAVDPAPAHDPDDR